MGNVVTKINNAMVAKIRKLFISSKTHSITMVGLDAAGKTTLLYFLKTGEVQHTVPTLGFNCEELEIENIKLHVWDIGGQATFLKFWGDYIKTSSGIIYIVDIADKDRYMQASEALWSVLGHQDTIRPVLVLANKADLVSKSRVPELVKELISVLNLTEYKGPYEIVPCSVISEGGGSDDRFASIFSGLTWLNKEMNNMAIEE